jgi:eukaryotic-like serine/threonine-protein kinase
VLDFGLVKRGAERDGNAEHVTLDNLAGGTPAFMSPEQALGDKHLDGRSDLYAVGCVAYWLLTGTTVFEGQTPMETIVKHVNQEPEPPSRRSERMIPPEFETLILDCLAKRPEARPQTADELVARLEAIPLAEAWTPARSHQWWDQYRPLRQTERPAELRRPGVA